MQLTPLPYYFIVKINTTDQENRKEKIGSLYLHFNEVQMQRNMQCGEICAVGSKAASQFKEAKVGDILIFHHFVEGSDKNKSNIIYSDDTYNYYNVTASEYNGRRNETYGLWNGTKIIPHPDFVFIVPEIKSKEISADTFIESNTIKVGSLLLFSNWEEKREDKEYKTKVLTEEIKNLSKSSMNDQIKIGIETKEKEAADITLSLNRSKYTYLKVAFHNSKWIKDNVYALNQAALTEIDFMDKKYILLHSKYIVATA